MSATWYGAPPPDFRTLTAWDYARAILRGVPLAVLVFGGLAVLMLIRLIERPLCGASRPVTPFITVFVCKLALRILGICLSVAGSPLRGQGAVVANHASWLDIFVLNAVKRLYFVSKSEVAGWPGIGWLARATGTVFIQRDRAQAASQAQVFQQRLAAGHKLLFFPEGTSSDGRRVLPFKSTLFAAFFTPELRDVLSVQPATVNYTAPDGLDARFFGWWGDMDFGPHFLQVLAAPSGGQVHVTYHAPLKVSAFDDRKALSAACETAVRSGFTKGQ
ncbi:MAG: lysophospholipid acyltransferase family protein [Roseobacter sp.]